MKNLVKTLTLLLALVAVSSAHAIPFTGLFDGGSVIAGDKLFDQWTLVFQGTSDGHTVNTDNIDVTPLGPVGSNPLDPGPGLRFAILNNELTVAGDGIYAYIDLQFGFRVSVLDPSLRVKDNSLVSSSNLSSNADGTNDLGTYILEIIGTAPGLDDLGTKDVEFSILDEVLTADTTDSATFAPQSEIFVTKNILVWSRDVGDTAGLNEFHQRFSQTRAVPEPSTLALLGIAGLAGYLTRRRAFGLRDAGLFPAPVASQ